jgi:TetR/AcrR family transcriptional regulator of autoinduction and epiphytic fitness
MAELIRSPDLARDTYALFRRQQTGLERWLAAAAQDGRLAIDDPTWAADAFYGLLKSYALWPQLLGGQPAPDPALRARITDTAVTLFLAGHTPPPGASDAG